MDSSRASDTPPEPGPLAWIDGRLLPASAAVIPVGDAGFVLGTTVTEQLRTFRGVPFLPGPHAARFGRSLATAGIAPAHPIGEIFAAVDAVAAACHAAGPAFEALFFAGDLKAWASGTAGSGFGFLSKGSEKPSDGKFRTSASRRALSSIPLCNAAVFASSSSSSSSACS